MARKVTQPTWTSLVLKELEACDDFMDYRMLMDTTGGTQPQISAACIHLRKRRAVDCIIEADGVAWWYATPDTDNRTYKVEERAVEISRERKSGYHVKRSHSRTTVRPKER